MKGAPLILAFSLGLTSEPAQASESLCAAPWQRWDDVGREVVRPVPLALIGGAALAPLALSPTGGDYSLRTFAQTELGGSYAPEPVSVLAPYVVLGGTAVFYGTAAIGDWCKLQKAPTAMLQGMGSTLVVVGLTKWITGREWPNGGRDPDAEDRLEYPDDAKTFRPFRVGLGAFPSGHTAVMFSAAAALRSSSPELGAYRYLGYPFATAVGFLMWWGDHHWASDVLSGALLGEALGGAAGRAWVTQDDAEEVSWLVIATPDAAAVGVSGVF